MSWTEWKEKLRAAFADRIKFPVRMTKMLARTKQSDEKMAQYFYDKMALITPSDLEEKKSVQCIAYGIKDEAIKAAIRVADLNTTEILRSFLSKYDADYIQRQFEEDRTSRKTDHRKYEGRKRHKDYKPYSKWGPSKYAKGGKQEKQENHDHRSGPTTQQKDKKEKFQGDCFTCGGKGHYAR